MSSKSITIKTFTNYHPICLLHNNKEELLSSYKFQATDLLQRSFTERCGNSQFLALAEVTPCPQVLQVYRMLFALIGESNITDYYLNQIDWVGIDSCYTYEHYCGKDSSICLKNFLLDHENIEKKLRDIIRNPEKVVPKEKFLKLQQFFVKNEKIFKWLDDNKNNFVYNKLVYYLAQIIKLTINLLDNLVKTQGDLIKSTKKFRPLRIKKVRWDSYKRLLKKQTRASTFNYKKKYSNISNIYHVKSKFHELQHKSAPPCYD